MWVAGITLAAIAGLIGMSEASFVEGEKDIKGTVAKIADALKAGDKETAKKLATAAAKNIDEIGDVMHMFRPREKGGMGIGPKVFGTNKAKDGIEITLRDLARDVPANVAKQSDALEAAGYYIAAIAELTAAKGWAKDSGKKTKKAWNEYSEEMTNLGIAFAKAANGKGAQQMKTAAAKLNENCNRCHSLFKE
jgi:hypothetical protein